MRKPRENLDNQLGKVYQHDKWGPYEVIEVFPVKTGVRRRCRVRFLNTDALWEGTVQAAKSGLVRDYSLPSVYGLGVTFKGASRAYPQEYVLWTSMLSRCYSGLYHKRFPSYEGATVCARWLVFINFLEDLPSIPGYQKWKMGEACLDKDSLVPGNKTYAPGLVTFISLEENSREAIERNRKAIHTANCRPVRNLRTGKIYESACAAERSP